MRMNASAADVDENVLTGTVASSAARRRCGVRVGIFLVMNDQQMHCWPGLSQAVVSSVLLPSLADCDQWSVLLVDIHEEAINGCDHAVRYRLLSVPTRSSAIVFKRLTLR